VYEAKYDHKEHECHARPKPLRRTKRRPRQGRLGRKRPGCAAGPFGGGAGWVAGSSSSSTRGCTARARANRTRCFSPPESWVSGRAAKSWAWVCCKAWFTAAWSAASRRPHRPWWGKRARRTACSAVSSLASPLGPLLCESQAKRWARWRTVAQHVRRVLRPHFVAEMRACSPTPAALHSCEFASQSHLP
jgi:hypothetical protein